MKANTIWILACCLVIGTALAACKSQTSPPGAGEEDTVVVRPPKPAALELDTAAPADVGVIPEHAQRSESGLAWVVLKEGAGKASPAEGDIAALNFIGWTADGKLVQESLTGGRPAAIAIPTMFPGLAEGVQSMVAGEKRRFWIPGKLAFGEATPGAPSAKKGPPLGMLVYDVELVRFATPTATPGAPSGGE